LIINLMILKRSLPHPPRSRKRRTTMSSGSKDFLDTAEGEVSLFRSIMRTRPVGIHRHVHILAIHNSIYRDTGSKVPMKDIWAKLGRMHDLDALENAVSSLLWCCSTIPSPCIHIGPVVADTVLFPHV
jgi:hypothetical protein